MEKINGIISAIKVFFTSAVSKETIQSLLTPREDYGRFFYWGFLVYFFANIFVTDFVSIIMVAVMVLIAQIILYGYKGRPLSIVDFVFAMLPALITSIHIWI